MKATKIVVVCALAVACSNDEFTSLDASADAASDGSSDGANAIDGSAIDACTPSFTPACACGALGCCVDSVGATCGGNAACSNFELVCRNGADCQLGDAGPLCCLEMDAGVTNTCPVKIHGAHGLATCVATGACTADGFVRLCAVDADCGPNAHCARATFEINGNVEINVCL